MTINYNQLDYINKTIKKFPNAKLQIVSKNQDEKTVKEIISKGFYLFGENKVQEASEKWEEIKKNNQRIKEYL